MGSFCGRSNWSEKEVARCHQRHRRIFMFRSPFMNHSSLYVKSFDVCICISLRCFEKEKDVSWELHYAKLVVGWGFWARVPADFGRSLLLTEYFELDMKRSLTIYCINTTRHSICSIKGGKITSTSAKHYAYGNSFQNSYQWGPSPSTTKTHCSSLP